MGRPWILGTLLLALAACGPESPPGAERQPGAAAPQQPGTGAQEAAPAADLVLRNAYIYTVDSERRIAQALAVRGGRIVYVGSDDGARPYIGDGTRVEDLDGKLVLPGFIDSYMYVGNLAGEVDLYDGDSIADYQQAVAQFIEAHPQRQLVVGRGWDGSTFSEGTPHKAQLDQVNDLVPIVLYAADHHTIWTNSEAIAAAGIDNDTPDPEGGVIERDETGLVTGVFRGRSAMALVEKIIPPKNEADYRAQIRAAQDALARRGITTVHDAYIRPTEDRSKLDAYQKMAGLKNLTVRVRGSFSLAPGAGEKEIQFLKTLSEKYRDEDFQVHSARLVTDGGVAAARALLKQPYRDRPDHRGAQRFGQKDLNQMVKLANAARLQVMLRTVGDAAVDMALTAFAHSRDINGPEDLRNALVHLRLVDQQDLQRFVETHTVALVLPYRLDRGASLRAQGLPQLGDTRAAAQYPLQSLFDAGITVAAGSNRPGSSPGNPLAGIQLGVTRGEAGGGSDPAAGDGAGVSVEEMVAAFTINGAFANRLEEQTGSLEPGKWADMVVLDRNLFQVAPQEIGSTRVLQTYYRGRQVFGAGE